MIRPSSRAWSRMRRGWSAQSSKSAGHAEGGDPLHLGSERAGADAQRAPGAEAGQPHDRTRSDRQQVVDRGGTSSSHPASEKSPSDWPDPRKLNDEDHPAHVDGDPVGQLRERRGGGGGAGDAGREPVAQHDAGHLAGERGRAGRGGPRSGSPRRRTTPRRPRRVRPARSGLGAVVGRTGADRDTRGSPRLRASASVSGPKHRYVRASIRSAMCSGSSMRSTSCTTWVRLSPTQRLCSNRVGLSPCAAHRLGAADRSGPGRQHDGGRRSTPHRRSGMRSGASCTARAGPPPSERSGGDWRGFTSRSSRPSSGQPPPRSHNNCRSLVDHLLSSVRPSNHLRDPSRRRFRELPFRRVQEVVRRPRGRSGRPRPPPRCGSTSRAWRGCSTRGRRRCGARCRAARPARRW